MMEGGVSCPEIIEGDPEPASLELVRQSCRSRHVLEGCAFRDLEDQPAPSVLSHRIPDILQKISVEKMAGPDVQGNPE